MSYLEQKYDRNRVILGLRNNFLPDYRKNETIIELTNDLILQVTKLGICEELKLPIYEIEHSSNDARVSLTKEALKIIKGDAYTGQALFLFVPQNSSQYRISLVTYDWIDKEPSNPRRFSFLVGEDAKTHTATKQLSKKVHTREELLKCFSIEVVNDEFYKKISEHFDTLIKEIKHPTGTNNTEDGFKVLQNFAVRLIGRLVFCWFLKKKHRKDGSQLISDGLLSSEAVSNCNGNYYHDVLEPLFFETLNKPVDERIKKCQKDYYKDIPFLNGGLFSPDNDDCYQLNDLEVSKYYNLLKINNNWFSTLFKVFETYNFTIDENTSTDIELSIDPEMLGHIFENLLATVNPETQESARRATGSFYTPREIVDYMVTQSLKQYLYTKTDIDHKKIDSLFELEHILETEEEKQKIYNALSSIKILDPAVGSGAFPMGILQKMMSITRLLYPHITISKKQDYQNKLKFIQKCIYGVDIQPMAIEICRLRFFLTLIVDAESDDIKPLPNLDFNFVCANSLIPLDNNNILELKQQIDSINKQISQNEKQPLLKGRDIWSFSEDQKNQIKIMKKELDKLKKERKIMQEKFNKANAITLLNGDTYIAQLREHREDFFSASGTKKEYFKQQFINTQETMLKALEANDWGNDKVIKLQSWKPFENNSTGWFDPFWMFGVEDGFDIVIANPPYVKVENMDKETIDSLQKELGYHTDLYIHFIFKGYELLKREGNLTFITNDGFLGFKNTKKVRELFFANDLVSIIKCPFETFGADIYTAIFVLNKQNSIKNEYETYYFESLYGTKNFNLIKCGPVSYKLSNALAHNRLVLNDDNMICIFKKLCEFNKMEKICDILDTGIDSGNCRNKILSFEETNSHRYKILQGKQINKYYFDWNSPKAKFKWCNINYIPANDYGIGRGGKKSTKLEYWHFRGNKENHEVVEKLLMRQTDDDLIVCYVNRNEDGLFYTDNTLFTIIPHKYNIKLLLGILNSTLLNYIYHFVSQEEGKAMAQVKTQIVDTLPFPEKIDKDISSKIIELVNKILAMKKENNELNIEKYEKEIDKLVYQLYGLTEEEIKIVEESQSKKK